MTEAEWLACEVPNPMLESFRGEASDRKLRLFAAACCRRIEPMLSEPQSRAALQCVEEIADGLATQGMGRATWQAIQRYAIGFAPYDAVAAALRTRPFFAAIGAADSAADAVAVPPAVVPGANASRTRQDESIQQVQLLRDIFGNPFRPVAFAPSWRTDTAIALAAQMYESRDFSAMPILADALQDAGCDSADVLDHCRGPGPHVRACWVVDLVLGKG